MKRSQAFQQIKAISRLGLLVATVGLASMSCALWNSTLDSALAIFEDPHVSDGPTAYRRGVRQLEQEDYRGALASFEESLRVEPTSKHTQVTHFNMGRAFEGLGFWQEAEEKYRAVARATTRAPKLQTLALYRLSFCHEAKGDDPGIIASLVDTLARETLLPDEIAAAELPARLAAAYARVGNSDAAMTYYERAEAGISRLRGGADGRSVPEWLPRTLYYMGRMSLRSVSWVDFESTLRPFGKAQLYLLQAAELGTGSWSRSATSELMRVYTEALDIVRAPPGQASDDDVVERRRSQERQWEMIEVTLEHLRRLRAARPPAEKNRSEQVDEIFAFVSKMERSLLDLLDQPLAGAGLTAEAKARRERVRGRTVRPDDSLERAYQQKRALEELKSRAEKSPSAAPPAPSQEDPNL